MSVQGSYNISIVVSVEIQNTYSGIACYRFHACCNLFLGKNAEIQKMCYLFYRKIIGKIFLDMGDLYSQDTFV